MEKKRSKGVTFFAWLIIILNIIGLLLQLNFKSSFDLLKSFNKNIVLVIILYGLLSAIIGIISGFGILKLKEIMRKIAVAINVGDVLYNTIIPIIAAKDIWQYSYSVAVQQLAGKSETFLSVDAITSIGFYSAISLYVFYVGLSLLFIFFFTRPKVKEQFKG